MENDFDQPNRRFLDLDTVALSLSADKSSLWATDMTSNPDLTRLPATEPDSISRRTELYWLYRAKPVLKGEDCVNQRFVFSNGNLVGQGGASDVVLGIDRLLTKEDERKVAAKILRPDSGLDQKVIQSEAELLSQLCCDPNIRDHIVEVYDVQTAYIHELAPVPSIILVQEYLEPPKWISLYDEILANSFKFGFTHNDNTRFLNFLRKSSKLIDYLAYKDIYHRDIKPTNIFVNILGDPKYLDFGISEFVDSEPGLDHKYSSPEWADHFKRKHADVRSEVFSLAVTCFQMLTSEMPYYTKKIEEGGEVPIFPLSRNTNLSSGLNYNSEHFMTQLDIDHKAAKIFPDEATRRQIIEVFEKALAVNPRDRYASCIEFYDDLRLALSDGSFYK